MLIIKEECPKYLIFKLIYNVRLQKYIKPCPKKHKYRVFINIIIQYIILIRKKEKI